MHGNVKAKQKGRQRTTGEDGTTNNSEQKRALNDGELTEL
jgi:hypothetical protein